MSRKSQLAKRRNEDAGQGLAVFAKREVHHFSGPLPPPAALEQYEKIQPGFANAILEMAQSAQKHSQEMEKNTLQLQKDFSLLHLKYFGRGQIIAGILGIAAIVGGSTVVALGHASAGMGIIGSVMGILGAAFAWGKWQEQRESDKSKKEE
jgi:uncharacterized membrane protein